MKPPYPAPVNEWHNDTYAAISPTRPELSQAGKTVVVTGGGQGIGREVVTAFAQAGAEAIHILGRSASTLQETRAIVETEYPRVKVMIHVVDITDMTAVQAVAKTVGSWDVMVANAGYIPAPDSIEASDADEWWKTFEINVKGNYNLVRSFVPFKKPREGTIVAFSSGFGFLPASLPFLQGNSAYSTSKMGTARLYEFVAIENPDLDIFVVQPGVVRTSLYEKGKLQLEDTIDSIQLPAHFTVWLASREAAPLSGQILFANWDVEELKSNVVPKLKDDPVCLTTTFGGFPFI